LLNFFKKNFFGVIFIPFRLKKLKKVPRKKSQKKIIKKINLRVKKIKKAKK